MFNSPVLVFDVETVPDVVSGRKALELDGIDDQEVVRAMSHRRRQKTGGSDFLAFAAGRTPASPRENEPSLNLDKICLSLDRHGGILAALADCRSISQPA